MPLPIKFVVCLRFETAAVVPTSGLKLPGATTGLSLKELVVYCKNPDIDEESTILAGHFLPGRKSGKSGFFERGGAPVQRYLPGGGPYFGGGDGPPKKSTFTTAPLVPLGSGGNGTEF